MDDVEAWAAIERALAQVGFERDWSATVKPTFVGQLDPSHLAAPASIEIDDLGFVAPPLVRLHEPGVYGRVIAHVLGPEGELCYLDRRARVLDRYDPGGTVLSCIEAAEKVLRDAVSGRSDDYLLEDFAAYWNGDFIYVDLDSSAKVGEIAWIALNPSSNQLSGVLTAKGKLAPALLARHRAVLGPKAEPTRQLCPIIMVDAPLRVDPNLPWPPYDLEGMCAWLDGVAPGAVTALNRRFGEVDGVRRHFGLRATNGLYVLEIRIPDMLQKPEFMQTRRRKLLANLGRAGKGAPVSRISTVRIDAGYLSSRNLVDGAGFVGRRIALIGCGSIGGFLADQLARSGAGMGGGRLTLYDSDRIMPANLGRHILGFTALNRNKAEAVRAHLLETVPHLEVDARPVDAMTALRDLARHDLIIDATGEEAFSIAFNHEVLRRGAGFPPCLHIGLHGNGAAAEGLLRDGPTAACYKCLKPKLSEAPRHRVLRPGVTPIIQQNYACGDPLFVPYPISRGVAAAGLALDMALDWSAGRPSPRHRTRVFEAKTTFQPHDGDLARSDQCPACRAIP